MPAIRHVGIVVAEDMLKKSLRFYKALGFNPWRKGLESPETMTAYVGVHSSVSTFKSVSKAGAVLELLVFHDVPRKASRKRINSVGITHFAITVPSLAPLEKKIPLLAGKLLTGTKYSRSETAPVVMFCQDPSGNLLELVEERKRRRKPCGRSSSSSSASGRTSSRKTSKKRSRRSPRT